MSFRKYDTIQRTVNGAPINIRLHQPLLARSRQVGGSVVLSSEDRNVITNLVEAIDNAQKYVTYVIKHVLTNATFENFEDIFYEYFNPGGTAVGNTYARHGDGFNRIVQVINAINRAIYRAHAVKVREWTVGEGYVTTHTAFETGETHQGEIHINKTTLLTGQHGLRALTYIHEASHKFAQTHDFPPRGYVDGEGRYKGTLTYQEACDNADSYAWFIWKAASTGQERINQERIRSAVVLGNSLT